jgi:hypothetical protein
MIRKIPGVELCSGQEQFSSAPRKPMPDPFGDLLGVIARGW